MSDNPPAKAEFNVGTYDDGSGPVARVSYDSTSKRCADRIWIDGGDLSEQWFAFDYQYADELIAAIKQAATMLAERAKQ